MCGVFRLEKLPSQNAYRDLKTWWNMCAKGQTYWGKGAPQLPSIQEINDTKGDTLAAEGIIVFKREITSVRAVSSSVQINTEWYPRDCTCLLTLRAPIAETCAELLEKLEAIAISGKRILLKNVDYYFHFCCYISDFGLKWTDASASLKDLFEDKYVKRWTSNCKFDVRFGFKSPYLALQFSGKMLENLRLRWSLKPSNCMLRLGKKTIRVNSWKTDLRMLCIFRKMKFMGHFCKQVKLHSQDCYKNH